MFIAIRTGAVYSLDADTGCTHWGFQAGGSLRSGVTIGDAKGAPAVFFSDGGGTMYALNAQTGELIWKVTSRWITTPPSPPRRRDSTKAWSTSRSPPLKKRSAAIRNSSAARFAAAWSHSMPPRARPSGRHSQFPKPQSRPARTPAGPQQHGPSGAGIWSTPTIDEQLGALYVATGDNYSDPPTEHQRRDPRPGPQDRRAAVVQATHRERCLQQRVLDSAANQLPCESAVRISISGSRPSWSVSARESARWSSRQKSGMVHAIDPDQKGKMLWQTRAGAGGYLGGSQWGSASDGEKVYVAISDIAIGGVADPKSPQGFRLTLDPKKGGGLHALDLKTGKIVWSAKPSACAGGRTDCSPAQSAAVTAIPGVSLLGLGRRTPARLLRRDRRSPLGCRHGPRVPDGERQARARRLDGCRGPRSGQRHGVCELRLRPMGRYARQCISGIFG